MFGDRGHQRCRAGIRIPPFEQIFVPPCRMPRDISRWMPRPGYRPSPNVLLEERSHRLLHRRDHVVCRAVIPGAAHRAQAVPKRRGARVLAQDYSESVLLRGLATHRSTSSKVRRVNAAAWSPHTAASSGQTYTVCWPCLPLVLQPIDRPGVALSPVKSIAVAANVLTCPTTYIDTPSAAE